MSVTDEIYPAYSRITAPQARRLVRYLVDHPDGPLTGEIAHAQQIGNVSDAACKARKVLEPHGFTIVAVQPRPRVLNKFGRPCNTHKWYIRRVR